MIKLFRVNHCSIKAKLFIIYLFCVLVPLIATNIVMLEGVKRSALSEQAIDMNHIMERIKYNMTSDLSGSISGVSHLYIDKNLNEFLNRHYESNAEYYDYFSRLLQNNMIRYYYNSERVYRISIYADNSTLTNGGNFGRIDNIEDTEWYQGFKESGESTYLTAYYNEIENYLITANPRTISLIKKLNYLGDNEIEKIIKVDLDYMTMLRKVLNEKSNATIYVCNEDKVLFSNQINENLKKDFMSKEKIDLDTVKFESSFNMVNEIWQIYIIPEKIHIWEQYMGSGKRIWGLVIINLVIPTIIISCISRSFTERIKVIEAYLDKVKREQFEVIEDESGKDEIGNLIRSYNLMVIKIKNLIEVVFKRNAEAQTLQLAKKEAELKALQSQVNPHFMFNTLESIRMRSLIKGEAETADIIGELSLILRKSLAWNSEYIEVSEEIIFVKRYLHLQKYRFGDKLSFYFFVMPDCEEIKIPKFCILTFVENACVHGLEGIAEAGSVTVTVTRVDEKLCFEISDSGCGIAADKLAQLRQSFTTLEIEDLSKSKSTGIMNTLIRLKLLCEGEVTFEIESEIGRGTDIILELPLNQTRLKEDE